MTRATLLLLALVCPALAAQVPSTTGGGVPPSGVEKSVPVVAPAPPLTPVVHDSLTTRFTVDGITVIHRRTNTSLFVANLYLLPRYGIVGAAMASAFAYALSAVLITAAFARRYGVAAWVVLAPELPWRLWRALRAA